MIADEPPEENEEEEEGGGGSNISATKGLIQADTEVVVEERSNTTLVCDHERDDSVQEVTLERMPHNNQPWGVIGLCRKIEGGAVAQNYSGRGRLSCTPTLAVSLHLTGVQQQDAGLYRCRWNKDGRPQTTTVLLLVQPAGTETLDISKCGF